MAVRVRMLGGFEVTVDGTAVAPEAWSRRHAASLVKLLALARDRRMHREQVVEALWPGIPPDAVGPRLHKAAHYARRALGDEPASVVLRNETVALLPGVPVEVDAGDLLHQGAAALAQGTPEAAEQALSAYGGPLLPDDVYEPWTEAPREAVRVLHLDLLRQARRWREVLEEEPADEQAHLALVSESAERGDLRAARRQLERLDQALRHELGATPSAEAEAWRARLDRDRPAPATTGTRLFGRRQVGDRVRAAIERAEKGRGTTLVFTGPAGVGKSAVLDLTEALARRSGWRVGRGTASEVEGLWPYSPVLEALAHLSRQHPGLLDGLDDVYRDEIERALSGRDVRWTGESGHQRLFVATAELVRLAATGHGLLLVVDDVHEADQASLRLLHYLSRCALDEPVVLALAHRRPMDQALGAVVDSMVARGSGTRVELQPLSLETTRRMLAATDPDLDPATVEQIWTAGGGLPFTVLELARGGGRHEQAVLPALPDPVLRTLQRLALLGTTFTTDELLAVAGVGEDQAYRQLEAAVAALLVEARGHGYVFRHPLVRDALVGQIPPHAESAIRREVADLLAGLGAPPARVAHQYVAAGVPSRAVPYVVRAVETAGALGAYRDALTLVDAVREHAGPADLPRLLARRADLLMALGDPEAVNAYREAIAVTEGTEHRLVRARLARAASFAGDLDTARAALAGLRLEDDVADAPILLARGSVAYFSGDVEEAWNASIQARERLQSPQDPWHLVDVVSLQGLIAHQRGEWFERFRMELRRTQGKEQLVTALFDAHLCVAEYLLYGRVPYDEVIADSEELRRRAAQAGALRGVAFATALIGEAALLSGDLERADRELREAVELHRDIDASSGEAHSLQRLAEVRLAQGRPEEARRLLQQALPLARWSVVSRHLLQRLYGTMIEAAPDPLAARAVVDRAESTLGENDFCTFCAVMLAVPAARACAAVDDLEGARRHLAVAERSVDLWEGSAWDAAVVEVRAQVARVEGDRARFVELSQVAARRFRAFGHERDADRCLRSVQTSLAAAGS